MRSFNPFLVLILSFLTFAASSPLHPITHSSRLTKNSLSSRQFHYPRTIVDVCANVDLSLIFGGIAGLDVLGLFGNMCLCLSAFPLDLDIHAGLALPVKNLGQTKVQSLLQNCVRHAVFLVTFHILTVSSQGREEGYPVYIP